MATVVLMAVCISRKITTSTMFTVSLLGVVLLQPFALLSTGFWLSFGAVFALLYAFTGRRESGGPPGVQKAAVMLLLTAVKTQWIVFIAMLPLLLQLVFQVSLVAFLVNMIAIPFISFMVVPFLLGFVVMMPISPGIASLSLSAAEFFLLVFWQGIQWVSNLDWVFHGIAIGSAPFLVSLTGILIFFSPKGLVPRWLALLCLLPLVSNSKFPEPNQLHITFIDVGQGLSILLRTEHSAVLYDAGPRFGQRFDSGEQIVTPLLRQLGVSRLEAFIVSHGDNDHAGGMQSIIRNFEVNREISSFGGLSADCSTPHAWSVDGVNFEIFSLVDEEVRNTREVSGNDRSCVLMAFNGDYGFLITGDIEEFAESVLQDRNLPDIDVISVPHHGSRTSSTPGFINHVHPRLAIVSAGFHNRFNHPDPLVLRRYRQRHIKVLNTAEQGAISLLLGRGGIMKMELTRSTRRRFWHRKP
jgi:competence protein ComEC